jgi:hypothetical protein
MHGFKTTKTPGTTTLGLLLGGFLAIAASFTPAAAESVGAVTNLADTKPYTVAINKVEAKRGQPATAKVQFRATSGWHVNKDFPTELRLKLPDGVSAQKPTLTKADAKLTDEEGSFDVVLTAKQAGKSTVLGELRFAVCTATTCDPQRAPISIEITAQ